MSLTKAVLPLSDMLLIFAGPAIWFGHFSFIYGAQTFICIEPTASVDQRMLWTYAVVAIAALASLGLLVQRRTRKTGFLAHTSMVLTLIATLGVIWSAIPAMLLPACGAAN